MLLRFHIPILCVTLLTLCSVSIRLNAQTPSTSVVRQLKKAALPILPTKGKAGSAVQRMLADDARARLRRANQRETRAWRALKGKADWEKFAAVRLSALRKSLGNFPLKKKTKLLITRKRDGADYRVHNVVFETRPGLLATGNLYLPAGNVKSMPGILICHSHHNPKTQGELQDMGMTWAKLGCAVLVMDQIGHGERRQHPFLNAKSFPKKFRVSRQDYYFRFDTSLQLYLVGDSLMGWMVWDLMCGVDVLLAQPKIDHKRIILLGAVAGGGDPCAVAAALDKRIAAAVPFNFGGPQPENQFPLPPDAEDRFNYAGSGSWESTRNLHLSARDGFLPWVIVGGIAPRRLMYAHEFAWDKKNDPVWSRLQMIFRWYKQPDYLSSVKGRGSVRGRPPQSTHCNNIGPVHRRQIYPVLKKWFGMPIPEKESRTRIPTEQLLCLSPKLQRNNKKVHQLAAKIGQQRITNLRRKLTGLDPEGRRTLLRKIWRKQLGGVPQLMPKQVKKDTIKGDGLIVERVVLKTQRDILVPLIYLKPKSNLKTQPVVVAVAQSGKTGFIQQRAKTISGLIKNNIAVCLPDLRGAGETAPGTSRNRRSWITSISATHLMLGDTIRGGQCRDLLAVLRWLRERTDVDKKKIALWGDSFANVNAKKRIVIMPRGISDGPAQAEPMGATVVLLAALFDKNVRAVSVGGGLVSFLSIMQKPTCHVPHDEIIPGALDGGDVADLIGSLAPMRVRIGSLVNGLNQPVATADRLNALSVAVNYYRKQGTAKALIVGESRQSLAEWFRKQLR